MWAVDRIHIGPTNEEMYQRVAVLDTREESVTFVKNMLEASIHRFDTDNSTTFTQPFREYVITHIPTTVKKV